MKESMGPVPGLLRVTAAIGHEFYFLKMLFGTIM